MNDTKDFIFCPFCGTFEWIVNKIRNASEGRLDAYKCTGCKRFSYINIVTDNLIKIHQIIADVYPYQIRVFYFTNETSFYSIKNGPGTVEKILNIKLVIPFNWYKEDELLDKIKTYAVFS